MTHTEVAESARAQFQELLTVKALLSATRTTLTGCRIDGAADGDQIDRLMLVVERRLDDVIFEMQEALRL